MTLECNQILLYTSDLDQARDFYVGMLELPVVEEHPTMFAFRAGGVRFSVMKGGHRLDPEREEGNMSIMLRTNDLDADIKALRAKGLAFDGDVLDAPGFMRHTMLLDPDGNVLYLAEYVRDPLVAVG